MIGHQLKSLVQKTLGSFGFKLIRIESGIGMYPCMKGLAARGFNPKMIVDVGAARGDWTKLAMKFWPKSKYLLIEPLDERLLDLSILTEKYPNVKFILAGAGAEPGEAILGVTKELDGSSFMYDGEISRKVPVMTIDSLLQKGLLDQPQFMKLDVQGYELKVLEGAITALKTCELILLELQFFRFSPSMKLLHESIAWMVDREYRPYEIVDMMRRPFDNAMGQCDILFVHEGHWLLNSNNW